MTHIYLKALVINFIYEFTIKYLKLLTFKFQLQAGY
jgi:hypothetical protein